MKRLIDVRKSVKRILADNPDGVIVHIQGQMNYFPLCCSTGILEGVQANPVTDTAQYISAIRSPIVISQNRYDSLMAAKSISEVIQCATNRSYMAPFEFAIHYIMDLCRRKVVHGHDKHGPGAYSGFKAAQIAMFDRLLEDKDPAKGFKYSYNMTWSVGHFIEWLREQGDKYGEVLISTPTPGAHGARVYGCVWTPDAEALERYCAKYLPIVKEHYKILHEDLSKIAGKSKTKSATKGLDNFVSY